MRQDIQTDILTFRLGSEKLALPAEYLREILEVVPITRVPQSGKFATGLINVRGVVVPLADLRVALRIPRSPATEDTRILVLDVRVGDEKSTVAILADQVEEVTTINKTEIEDVPPVGSPWPPEFVLGIGQLKGAFVMFPDLDTIFKTYSAADAAKEKVAA
ncbi:chemotaxis protein CheW [Marivita sp.]|jgi:purine-binding chemotaxis protein CheW|uniref:chemotaxis protein CheW n=1 Tax=Marivita sp. TaxID=2003365 RepID=UPI00321B1A6A